MAVNLLNRQGEKNILSKQPDTSADAFFESLRKKEFARMDKSGQVRFWVRDLSVIDRLVYQRLECFLSIRNMGSPHLLV